MNEEQPIYIGGIPATAGKPGYNEWGVPLHACNGYRQDEHYWDWLKAKRLTKEKQ